MNTGQVEVHHHDGILFTKVEADTGITYMAVDPTEVKVLDHDLLVRHGDPTSGNCGYYPLWLLATTREVRRRIANNRGKRPPQEVWVEKMKTTLVASGVSVLH